jgi:hypothetical protein
VNGGNTLRKGKLVVGKRMPGRHFVGLLRVIGQLPAFFGVAPIFV